jgi:hypothetical protein
MGDKEIINYNPATMEILGTAPVMSKDEVLKRIGKGTLSIILVNLFSSCRSKRLVKNILC